MYTPIRYTVLRFLCRGVVLTSWRLALESIADDGPETDYVIRSYGACIPEARVSCSGWWHYRSGSRLRSMERGFYFCFWPRDHDGVPGLHAAP